MQPTQSSSATAIPFIYLHEQKFKISPESIQFLKSIKNPVAILSIVGKYRTGKSLFLNRVMLQKQRTFKVSPTINSCTKGLWLWKDTIKVKNQHLSQQTQKQILIIDTQGYGATQQTDQYNNKILLFSLLLSSYLVYNSVGSIDQNSLNNLSVIANIANQIQNKNNKEEKLQECFPSFMWLVRDFTLGLVDKDGGKIGAKQYLQQALQLQKGSSQMIESKNRIRRMIKNFFQDRDCFTLVRPVETQDNLQQLDTLPQQQFRVQFLQQTRSLRQRIMKRIKIKKLKNTRLSGENFLQLASLYVQTVNNNSIPNIQSSYKHLLKLQTITFKKHFLSSYSPQIISSYIDTKLSQNLHNNDNMITKKQQFQIKLKKQFIQQIQIQIKNKIKQHSTLSMLSGEDCGNLVGQVNEKVGNAFSAEVVKYEKRLEECCKDIVGKYQQDCLFSYGQGNDDEYGKGFQQLYKEFNKKLLFMQQSFKSQYLSQHNNKLPQLFLPQFLTKIFLPFKLSISLKFIQTLIKKSTSTSCLYQSQLSSTNLTIKQLSSQLHQLTLQKTSLIQSLTHLQHSYNLLTQSNKKQSCNQSTIIIKLQKQLQQNQKIIEQRYKQINKKDEIILKYVTQIQLKNDKIKQFQKQNCIIKVNLQNKIGQIKQKKQQISQLLQQNTNLSHKLQLNQQRLHKLRQQKQHLYQKHISYSQQYNIKMLSLQKQISTLQSQLSNINSLNQSIQFNSHNTITQLKQKNTQLMLSNSILIQTNSHLTQTISSLQQRICYLLQQQKVLKEYKKCIKNSVSIQCQHCQRFFLNTVFKIHLDVCNKYKEKQGKFNQENQTNLCSNYSINYEQNSSIKQFIEGNNKNKENKNKQNKDKDKDKYNQNQEINENKQKQVTLTLKQNKSILNYTMNKKNNTIFKDNTNHHHNINNSINNNNNNNTKNLHKSISKQNIQTPQQFFKIWQQQQKKIQQLHTSSNNNLRIKSNSLCTTKR